MTQKIIAILSSAIILGSSLTPVLAIDPPADSSSGTTIEISGNGSGATSVSNVSVTQTTQVTQTNTADIENNINSSSNSGGNDAKYNTGGDVVLNTGSATTSVAVTNTANSNVATVDDCKCGVGDVSVKIADNGANTTNTANAALQNTVTLGQTNVADIDNNVHAKSNSGHNDANSNTGGSVMLSTGNALTTVDLSTNANQNLAVLGGNGGNGASTSVLITGNGTGSTNVANLALTDWIVLGQTNVADVDNQVHAKANTGYNNAKYNTGGSDTLGLLDGDVSIDTGNATTDVEVDNAVNFNAANIECDCIIDVTAKIAGNGASHGNYETDSRINATIVSGQQVGQVNAGEGIDNYLDSSSKSGYNDANSNTAESADPSLSTGNAMSNTEVNNLGNSNVFGDTAGDSFPFPWDWNWNNSSVSITFDLSQLIAALGL